MKIGRPLEFDPEQALESAMQLFWSKGYESTSLQDLLRAMGLSKSSFYQAFGSKHRLFERCVTHYRDTMVCALADGLEKAASGRRFIEQILLDEAKEARRSSGRRGCLVMNTASEFGHRDPEVAKLVSKSTDKFIHAFLAAVQRAQKEGDIPPEQDARALARYLVSSMSGLKTMVKAGAGPGEVKEIVTIILSALD